MFSRADIISNGIFPRTICGIRSSMACDAYKNCTRYTLYNLQCTVYPYEHIQSGRYMLYVLKHYKIC